MSALASILVDIDAVAADPPGARAGRQLPAMRAGARVKLVDVLPRVPAGVRHFVTPDLEKELIDHRRERLKAIADVLDRGLRSRPNYSAARLGNWR